MSPQCGILGWFRLTHDGDGERKEYGGNQHNAVNLLSVRKLRPLGIAGNGKETDEDTYTTNSTLARELPRSGQVPTVHHALQERSEEERKPVADSGHSERPRTSWQRWRKKGEEGECKMGVETINLDLLDVKYVTQATAFCTSIVGF